MRLEQDLKAVNLEEVVQKGRAMEAETLFIGQHLIVGM